MKLGFKIAIGVVVGILVILGLLVVILLGVGFSQGGTHDKISKEFVDTTIPKIISEWDYDIFCQYSHSDMPSSVSKEMFEEKLTLPIKTQLGKFVSYDSSTGEATIKNINGKTTIEAKYESKVTFENGNATITTQLININDNWVITNLNIKSDKFELKN
jgi:hypothetical protein